jgi:predicted metal-dependent peptidase
MNKESTALDKYNRAELNLLLDGSKSFFAVLVMRLNKIEDKTIPTMCTDGKCIRFSPDFVDKLTILQVRTVIVHELGHCYGDHIRRLGSRDLKIWNMACDYSINNELDNYNVKAKSQGQSIPFPWPQTICPKTGKLIDNVLINHKFDNMGEEEIYNELIKNAQKQKQSGGKAGNSGGGNGQPNPDDYQGMGDIEMPKDANGKELSKDEIETLSNQWKEAVISAAHVAKMQGNLPASIERLVKEILEPTQPWRNILANLIKNNSREDYSWSKPNLRYLASGFYLPSLHSNRMPPIAIIIDTSGSIDGDILNRFMNEVENITSECRPEKIIIIDCDCTVQSIKEYDFDDILPRTFKGGGGTDFTKPLTILADYEICTAIYFTDLEGSFPDNPPNFPVIWASIGRVNKVPFGEIVKID